MLAVQTQLLDDESVEITKSKAPVLTLVKTHPRKLPHPLWQYATAARSDSSDCQLALSDFLKQHMQNRANPVDG